MPECENCERLPLNEYPLLKLIEEIEAWTNNLRIGHIEHLEELCREWRDNYG